MDEKLIKVLSEIAQDKEVVGVLVEALERGDILERCPGTLRGGYLSLCPELCQKIWPDLTRSQCPCSKPNRLEIAQAIVALSKLVKETERKWQQGDVVAIGNCHYVLCYTESDPCRCNIFNLKDGCRKFGAVLLDGDKRIGNCSASELFRGEAYEYLGHISELTIKNGKVIK